MQKHVGSSQVVIELHGAILVADGLARRVHLGRDKSFPLDRGGAMRARQGGQVLPWEERNGDQAGQDDQEEGRASWERPQSMACSAPTFMELAAMARWMTRKSVHQ